MNTVKFKILALASLLLILTACSKEVFVNLDIPEADTYAKVYMPQAVNNPIAMGVSITDQDIDVPYSAYLGGPQLSKTDIPVTFSVLPEQVSIYNQEHGTSYELMPEGSYVLETPNAVIPVGKQTTGVLKLKIKTLGFLNAFETYLLPVTLSQTGDVGVNAALTTTYYLFTGSYAPGEVPREKVLAMGPDAGVFIVDYNGDFLRKAPSGDLLFYKVDASTGLFNEAPKVISTGWNVMDRIFSYGGNRIIGRFAGNPGNINQYFLSQDGSFGAQREVGQGWGVLAEIVPFKGLLLGIMPDGSMTKYPLNGNGDFDYGNIRQIGSGWTGLKQIFQYQNSLITIEMNGDMWQYPLSDDGAFGTRTKVGTGWDMYEKIIIAGTDLLALDSSGDLWRYKFNPAGLWPLKK